MAGSFSSCALEDKWPFIDRIKVIQLPEGKNIDRGKNISKSIGHLHCQIQWCGLSHIEPPWSSSRAALYFSCILHCLIQGICFGDDLKRRQQCSDSAFCWHTRKCNDFWRYKVMRRSICEEAFRVIRGSTYRNGRTGGVYPGNKDEAKKERKWNSIFTMIVAAAAMRNLTRDGGAFSDREKLKLHLLQLDCCRLIDFKSA